MVIGAKASSKLGVWAERAGAAILALVAVKLLVA
jgi:hypothetical protein